MPEIFRLDVNEYLGFCNVDDMCRVLETGPTKLCRFRV
jgi:hypothetical protein